MNRLEMPKLFEFDKNTKKIFVVSDLHGYSAVAESAVKAWEKAGGAAMVFLGDYADRGARGVETIEWLSQLSEQKGIVLLKGNHEIYTDSGTPLFSYCGLVAEAAQKRGDWKTFFQTTMKPFLTKLHLAALLPGKILFVHGGVSSRIRSLDDLRCPTSVIETDIYWNDPREEPGEIPGTRDIGYLFGPEISAAVLTNTGVKMLIRGHQPHLVLERPFFSHNGRIMTFSSTNVFGGKPYYLEIDTEPDSDQFSYQVHY
jgi:predicted phosphodiesterase